MFFILIILVLDLKKTIGVEPRGYPDSLLDVFRDPEVVSEYEKFEEAMDAGKFFSEALTLTSTNPQYDLSLIIESPVQYMKIPSSEHVVYINCSEYQNKIKKPNLCTQHVLSLEFSFTELVIQ